ncbi:DUF4878 domain-containing protein [Nostoc ellipsosporum NOK]|nr:DUF4878 domain-containing protein [Nostoc ellipsosporum NOK]
METDVLSATSFIREALKGNFDLARTYMLQDSVNDGYMDAAARKQRTSDERQGLFDASIIIHKRAEANDSTTVIVYSNSYIKQRDTLKMVKKDGKWLVDLKFLFDHDRDTTLNKLLAAIPDKN